MLLLVVRCLAFVVVHALMRPRVNAGAICSTGAASSALTGEIDSARSASVCAFACARASLCSACRAESIFKATAGLSVCVSTVSFGLPWRGFGLFGKLGRQNERRFIGLSLGRSIGTD